MLLEVIDKKTVSVKSLLSTFVTGENSGKLPSTISEVFPRRGPARSTDNFRCGNECAAHRHLLRHSNGSVIRQDLQYPAPEAKGFTVPLRKVYSGFHEPISAENRSAC